MLWFTIGISYSFNTSKICSALCCAKSLSLRLGKSTMLDPKVQMRFFWLLLFCLTLTSNTWQRSARCLAWPHLLRFELYFHLLFFFLWAVMLWGFKWERCPCLYELLFLNVCHILGYFHMQSYASVTTSSMKSNPQNIYYVTLLQVHDEREMDRVLGIEEVEFIGINNRNLGKIS